jgi:predicted transcriptional regulator
MKQQLMNALQDKGSLSSFEAQVALDLKECDWAPATLRRLFTELEEAKLIAKSGQKRGTRYVWKGAASTAQVPPAVKLVKAETDVD